MTGWQVLGHRATGLRSVPAPGGFEADGRDAIGTPSGGIIAFSARVPAGEGVWEGSVELRCEPPALVDVAVVAGREVPVPGPPPQAPPYAAIWVGPTRTVVQVRRRLGPDSRTVGLRVRAPLGCLLRASRATVGRDGGPTQALSAEVTLTGTREPFAAGALLAREEDFTVTATGPDRLQVHLEDRYRESRRYLHTGPGRIVLPTSACGAFCLVGSVDGVPVATWRYLVAPSAGPVAIDPDSPWGLTTDANALDTTGELLDLLGVRHVRTYAGLAAWDLPAVLACTDPGTAGAVVDGLEFTGSPAGSPAAVASREAAGREPGTPRPGWPDWRLAAALLGSADDAALQPVAALWEPLRGRTLLAETSQPADAETFSRVAERMAAALRGREVSWVAANEPDLGQQDDSPEQVAAYSAAFAGGVRRGDPGATVVGPALADGWDGGHQLMTGWDWLARWWAAGGRDAVDAVAVHLHMLDEETRTPEREDVDGLLRRLPAVVPGVPLWVTEMGWRSRPDAVEAREPGESGPAVSEADQADLLVRAAVLAAAAGVARFYAFHLTGWRVTGEGHRFAWGLLSGHHDGPKPAFGALRTLCATTVGTRVAPPLPTAARLRAVPFHGAARDLHVVWQVSGGPGLWTLDGPPCDVELHDVLGEPSPGRDLRRPLFVHSAAADRPAVHGWLCRQLAPRHGEPSLPEVHHVPT